MDDEKYNQLVHDWLAYHAIPVDARYSRKAPSKPFFTEIIHRITDETCQLQCIPDIDADESEWVRVTTETFSTEGRVADADADAAARFWDLMQKAIPRQRHINVNKHNGESDIPLKILAIEAMNGWKRANLTLCVLPTDIRYGFDSQFYVIANVDILEMLSGGIVDIYLMRRSEKEYMEHHDGKFGKFDKDMKEWLAPNIPDSFQERVDPYIGHASAAIRRALSKRYGKILPQFAVTETPLGVEWVYDDDNPEHGDRYWPGKQVMSRDYLRVRDAAMRATVKLGQDPRFGRIPPELDEEVKNAVFVMAASIENEERSKRERVRERKALKGHMKIIERDGRKEYALVSELPSGKRKIRVTGNESHAVRRKLPPVPEPDVPEEVFMD